MAEQTLSIRISAQDGASKVFRALEKSAKSVADSLEEAGKEGASGFQQVEKAAKSADSTLMKIDSTGTGVVRTFGNMSTAADKLVSGAVKLGSGLETVGRTLDSLGQSYLSQERQIDGVRRAYGDAADEALKFADQMQDQLGIQDDAVRQSELLASSLVNNYQMSFDQVSQLISRSADLAQIFGISLDDAVQRTSSALRGEGESAEMLSLNMSDATIAAAALNAGITNWNVPGALSEAEKAAFRFQVFMEQSAFATGAAADAADTASGKWRKFGAEVQDAAQAAGEFVGPWGDIIGTTGGGLATLGQAAEGIKEITAGLKALKAFAATGWGTAGIFGVAGGIASYGLVKMIGQIQDVNEATETLNRLDLELEIKGSFDKQALLKDVRETFSEAEQWLESGSFGFGTIEVPERVKAQIGQVFAEAFTDPSVDSNAFADWFNAQVESFKANNDDMGLSQFLGDLDSSDLDQFRGAVDATTDSVAELGTTVAATAGDIKGIFADLPMMLDDLRLDGKGDVANQLDQLHTSIVDTFDVSDSEIAAANANVLKMLPAEDQAALMNKLRGEYQLTTDEADRLGDVWQRISDQMATGTLDNAAIMADVNAILGNTELDAGEKLAELEALSSGMAKYVDQFATLKDAQVEWLANGDNILDWWQSYYDVANSGGMAIVRTQEQMERLQNAADFRIQVGIADDLDDAGAALDGILRTYQQIDDIGQRSASAGSIAENLVGEPGVWSEIDDMLAEGKISLEDYTTAVEAGHRVQESNARSQDYLNQVRRDQLPILADETEAYEDNIRRLADLEPYEQRRVLMLQDSAVQSQVASLYSQAYAASLGEIPKDVATQMILEAAEADAGLKDLLLNLGLLQENADGTISVNFPNAENTGQAIDRVTMALLRMQAIAEGKTTFEVAVELYGEDDALALFGLMKDENGQIVQIGVNVETTGTGVEDIKQVTLADGTVVTVSADVDTTGWDNSTVGELINSGDSAKVNTVLEPPTGWSVDDWNNSEGPLPTIEVPTEAAPVTEAPDYQGGTVDVPANVQLGNPVVGDGTGGAMAGMTPEQQQITIDILANDQATQTINDVSETASGIDGQTSTIDLVLDDQASVPMIGAYASFKAIDGQVSTLDLGADTSDAQAGIDWAQAYDGSILATSYIDIVTRQTTVTGTRSAYANGGTIRAYANGGSLAPDVPFWAGEAGPELATFANGGTAYIPVEGLYTAPAGTTITPAHATQLRPGSGQEPAINVTMIVNGPIIGLDDLDQVMQERYFQPLARLISEQRRGQGL